MNICSPGIGTEHSTDEQIEKNCKDADIFVYVCNGIATLEHLVSRAVRYHKLSLLVYIPSFYHGITMITVY